MNLSRSLVVLPVAIVCLGLSGCLSTSPPADDAGSSDGAGHGEIEGAAEVAEPPLGLLSVDTDGKVGLLDLLNDEDSEIGTVDSPEALGSDGRYAFVTTNSGLEIIDSGRWTWDHVDHFHYYRADPRIVGTVEGSGPARVSTGMLSTAGTTGVYFAGSGEAVLLDNAALADGEISESFRFEIGSDGGVVAPIGEGALVSDGDELVFYDASGQPTDTTAACADASASITTRVALAIGCADGAVLATATDGKVQVERVPYPEGVDAAPARSFDGRKGRPTVAGLDGESGFWLLDTREKSWAHVDTGRPLERVVAVDDAEGHVVAVDDGGSVRVYLAESGEEVAATDALLESVDDRVSLTVDDQRAYLSDPVAGIVHEIDYAGDARVARTLETSTAPEYATEVGR